MISYNEFATTTLAPKLLLGKSKKQGADMKKLLVLLLVLGVLQLTMGNKPGKKWGTRMEDVPGSMSLQR